MKLFKKPSWLRPEVDETIYYVHIAIILGVVYGLMSLYNPGNNLLIWGVYLTLGDISAHTILKLN